MDLSNLNGVWWFTAAAAVTTVTAAIWRHARSLWDTVSSYAIDTVTITGSQSEWQAGLLWICENTKPSPLISLTVRFRLCMRRGSARRHLELVENLPDQLTGNRLRWYRTWWPVWITENVGNSIHIAFLRGMHPREAIAAEVFALFSATVLDGGAARRKTRHFTRVLRRVDVFQRAAGQQGGQPGAPPQGSQQLDAAPRNPPMASATGADPLTMRLTRWISCRPEDIELAQQSRYAAMNEVALPDGADGLPGDIANWLAAESWFSSRQIPWRRGMLFYGPPGTGKTRTIRSLAVEFDLPLFLMDLNGQSNDDLARLWEEASKHTPCIVVFEDFDTVFHGRTPVSAMNRGMDADMERAGGGFSSHFSSLTFDAVLQCLDGMIPAEGILTVVTTNKPEHLDEALAAYDKKTGMVKCRPGRIDRAVYFGPLNESGRWLIVNRILRDWPHADRVAIVEETDGMTGAELQELCTHRALARLHEEGYFDKPSSGKPDPSGRIDGDDDSPSNLDEFSAQPTATQAGDWLGDR